ncbi:MAG: GFA family protein [Gammaproteobacteria bacterium]|nr:GFA family protein [Gammaproteobacteria bacterium]
MGHGYGRHLPSAPVRQNEPAAQACSVGIEFDLFNHESTLAHTPDSAQSTRAAASGAGTQGVDAAKHESRENRRAVRRFCLHCRYEDPAGSGETLDQDYREEHMSDYWAGGCLCGAVRYRCEGDPLNMGLCQCERCQRQSGSAFLIATVFPRDAVHFTRAMPHKYETGPEGERLSRHFCANCGSAVMITLDRYPEIRSMMGGTLDDKTRLKPTFSLWCSSGQPWLTLPESIRLFPDYPDGLIA